jgi:hypothetical protein
MASRRRPITRTRRSSSLPKPVAPPPSAMNPIAPERDARNSLPMLEVMTITVLRKSTVRPCPSVSRPSSSTCSSRLNTSGWAFSISSNSTIE